MRGGRRSRVVACAFALALNLAVAASPRPAGAGPVVISTRPTVDAETRDLTFFVGGLNEGGRSLKTSTLDLLIDGQRSDTPPAMQSLTDWSAVAAEASQTWRPPLTVGLVYLWVQGVPAGVLDGIQGFFRRVPSRTPLYPTIYGRMRQDRARLTASEVSRLVEEVPYLEGYRPNLVEAIRLDLQEVVADAAALKILLVVTDGRDFADPKGDGPGDFGALGREIRKAGVKLLVVGYPPPEADAAQAAANLRELQEASGGFLRVVEQVQDLENALESLGQGVADLQRVRLATPWTWRAFGGSHRLSVKLGTGDGRQLTVDLGAVAIGGGPPWMILAVIVLALATGAIVVMVVGRRRGVRGGPDDDAVLTAAHDLIRRGASPTRAVEELSRSYPGSVRSLCDLGPEAFADSRFPYFRTRLGRLRMQEIRDILAEKSIDRPALGDELAAVLSESLSNRMSPEKAAETITARVPADDWTAFSALDLDQLAEALRSAARSHPVLGSPRARGAAVAIQDALRSGGGGTRGVLVGWLVRTGGPGPRGETLRLGSGETVVGQAPECDVRILGDTAVAARHCQFSIGRGEFTVAPLEGPVSIEGKKAERSHVLADGETIALGGGLFVFKCASAGNLARAISTAPPVRRKAQ